MLKDRMRGSTNMVQILHVNLDKELSSNEQKGVSRWVLQTKKNWRFLRLAAVCANQTDDVPRYKWLGDKATHSALYSFLERCIGDIGTDS